MAKKKYFLTTKRARDGYYHFYLNGLDVTGFWMDFFSGLNPEQEIRCHEIFIRRYAKKILESNKK